MNLVLLPSSNSAKTLTGAVARLIAAAAAARLNTAATPAAAAAARVPHHQI
jgi:hypothetical protein